MKYRINAYFSVLLITIAGAGAALLIIHVAYNNSFNIMLSGNGTYYASLQQSLLK